MLPDVTGRSVLDIGAWDGKYSFLAEQEGAARVVALDHYAWGVDFVARGAYWAECIAKRTLPDQSRDETDFWQPELPGPARASNWPPRRWDRRSSRSWPTSRPSTSTSWGSSTSCSTSACCTT